MKLRNKIMMSVSMLLFGLMLAAVNPSTASAKAWKEVTAKNGVYTFKKAGVEKYRVTVNGTTKVGHIDTLEEQCSRLYYALVLRGKTSWNFGEDVKLYLDGTKGAGSLKVPGAGSHTFTYTCNKKKGKVYLRLPKQKKARLVVRTTRTGTRLYNHIAAKSKNMIAMVSTKGSTVKMMCTGVPVMGDLTKVEIK